MTFFLDLDLTDSDKLRKYSVDMGTFIYSNEFQDLLSSRYWVGWTVQGQGAIVGAGIHKNDMVRGVSKK